MTQGQPKGRTAGLTGGVSYYPDHWPKEEWERDMRLIKESGLDLIRFGEFSWSWIEPREGEFRFDAYDEFMALAHRLGLEVLLCTPTAAPPEWLLHRYPHVRQLDQHGRPHRGGRHMISYNDPDARRLAERIVDRLVDRYKQHPALAGWQIDNEPTSGESHGKDRIYDYHPATISLFREFVRSRYDSLERLNALWANAFWSRSYSDWEELEPPREAGGNPSLWLAWMQFRDHNVTEGIRRQLALIRRQDPEAIVGTNIPEVGTPQSVWLAQDYWAQAKGLQYIGADLYIYVGNREQEKHTMAFSCDLLRSAAESAGAEFWISETQAGPHRLPWRIDFVGGLWEPDFLLDSAAAYAARGAKRILFFLWRPLTGGQEFGLNGLVRFDGSPIALTGALPEIVAEARRVAADDSLWERPVLYLHYSRDSLLLTSAYDPDETMRDALLGWHRLAEDLGYRVRFASDEDLAREDWEPGSLLALPYSLSIGEATAAALHRAHERGVRLIGSLATGYFSEYGTIQPFAPGYGLADLFGVRATGFDLLDGRSGMIDGEQGRGSAGYLYAEVELTGATAIRRDLSGRPLLTANGRHLYAAFDLGGYYERRPEARERLRSWWREAIGEDSGNHGGNDSPLAE
ncbi:beta-galactosidase [Cohnella sp. GCM10020058]|uniref:beta-galactosidase n=1 Tax=Cohnella sp. GCM10020058 TaxID=3317330 RepID=UPI003644E4E5